MSTRPPPAALLRQAVAQLAPVLPVLTDLGERFAAQGHELALVGGPVRDAFLGRPASDLDLATSARPDDTERILADWGSATWDMGRAFGTIGARRGEHVVEVTTYRADEYDGVTRKPVVAFGDSLEDDLVRRDFACNAMAVRLPEIAFVDPHGGLADLEAAVLRTPTAPEVSFGDDPLRMMRAARFVAQLGFVPDPAVLAAMGELAGTIERVSAERVRDELSKLLTAAHPRAGLELLVASGIAQLVLPELPALRLEVDEHHRHKDVYDHSMIVLEQAMDLEGPSDGPPESVPGPDLVLRLAALLHDIGKPATRRFESGGGVSFHHHEVVGAKLVAKRLKALRFDKDTTRKVARLVELHLRFHGYGDGQWTDSAVRRYVVDAGDLLPRLHRLTRADCTTRNVKKARRLAAAYDDLEVRIERLQAEEEFKALRPELDGNEIAQVLGISPGPVLGRAYKHLLQVRTDDGPVGKD
ncbi:CCA tRNA nucleotidyltransferase, partial [Phycicoccus flavus]|uniref:CCA tRNA nucleotidyltransferase n=1 Tax=Phycicoccus flavus TaxID=2502783 RepID=UPI002AC33721